MLASPTLTCQPRNLHSSPNINPVIKLSTITWAGHVSSMGEIRNSYKILAEITGRPGRRNENFIKTDLRRNWLWPFGLNPSGSETESNGGLFSTRQWAFGSVQGREFLDEMNDYQLSQERVCSTEVVLQPAWIKSRTFNGTPTTGWETWPLFGSVSGARVCETNVQGDRQSEMANAVGCHRPSSAQLTPGKKNLWTTLIHLGLELQLLLAKQRRSKQKTDTGTVFFCGWDTFKDGSMFLGHNFTAMVSHCYSRTAREEIADKYSNSFTASKRRVLKTETHKNYYNKSVNIFNSDKSL